jgi:rare lipoprotein A (peptidoglycan hydrolase)
MPRNLVRCYRSPDVRRPKVVASMALIAALATVAVPGSVGPWVPSPQRTPSVDLFAQTAMVADIRGQVTTTPPLDPGARSDGILGEGSSLFEPDTANEPPQARPAAAQPAVTPVIVSEPRWRLDRNVSWYGPGFYGNRTACGYAMTRSLIGVAHRTLPCGTRITFRNPANGRVVTAPVVDRGPYVSGRQWDLTAGLCLKLGHCYTGSIQWRYAG